MSERTELEARPRGGTGTAWEVLVREQPGDPMVHAGAIRAPTAAVADEQAGVLFDDPVDVWLCPAAETRRFTAREGTIGLVEGEAGGTDPDPELESEPDRGRDTERAREDPARSPEEDGPGP